MRKRNKKYLQFTVLSVTLVLLFVIGYGSLMTFLPQNSQELINFTNTACEPTSFNYGIPIDSSLKQCEYESVFEGIKYSDNVTFQVGIKGLGGQLAATRAAELELYAYNLILNQYDKIWNIQISSSIPLDNIYSMKLLDEPYSMGEKTDTYYICHNGQVVQNKQCVYPGQCQEVNIVTDKKSVVCANNMVTLNSDYINPDGTVKFKSVIKKDTFTQQGIYFNTIEAGYSKWELKPVVINQTTNDTNINDTIIKTCQNRGDLTCITQANINYIEICDDNWQLKIKEQCSEACYKGECITNNEYNGCLVKGCSIGLICESSTGLCKETPKPIDYTWYIISAIILAFVILVIILVIILKKKRYF